MKVESLGAITVNVKNLDEAIKRFSDVLGLKFVKIEGPGPQKTVLDESYRALEETKTRIAFDEAGYFELMESTPPVQKEGLRSIHFKVKDIEAAKKELAQKGMHLVTDVIDPPKGFKEAVFDTDDLYGVRLCLVEYKGKSVVKCLNKKV